MSLAESDTWNTLSGQLGDACHPPLNYLLVFPITTKF